MKLNLKLLLATLFGILISNFSIFAQTWNEVANLPQERSQAMSFSIGNKGYFFGGLDGQIEYKSELWEWDQATDSWLQKASIPGNNMERVSGVSFSIGDKGYVAIGYGNGMYSDLWEWDQVTDSWTQKSSLPGAERGQSACFVIGDKAYIVGGFNSGYANLTEVWEWDQSSDSWTQKEDTPEALSGSTAFSIGNKGYLLGGLDVNGNVSNKFWEWDSASNTWSEKTEIPTARVGSVAFEYNGDAFVCIGEDDSYLNDFWKWEASSNSWTQLPDFDGSARARSSFFQIGSKAYVLGGANGAYGILGDMWEIDLANATTADLVENNLEELISIYPNPAQYSFNINLNSLNESVNVKILDLLGKEVYNSTSVNPSVNKSLEINTSEYTNGTYFVQIESMNEKCIKKLVVRK